MKVNYLKHLVVTVSVAAGVSLPTDAFAGIDMFLKIEGIKGESADAKHKDEIDVLAWSWGESTAANAGGRGGLGAGKTCVRDVQITKYIDVASPPLIAAGATGRSFKMATLTMTKAGMPGNFLTVKLSNVSVSSYATSATGNDPAYGDRPLEKVSLQFDVMDGSYTPLNSDGMPSGNPVTWQVYGPSSGNCP